MEVYHMKKLRMKRRFHTVDKENIADSIASNWNEGNRSELLCEIQAITLQNLQIKTNQITSNYQKTKCVIAKKTRF